MKLTKTLQEIKDEGIEVDADVTVTVKMDDNQLVRVENMVKQLSFSVIIGATVYGVLASRKTHVL